jgi:uncharacterized protein YdeI (YjbR/CyaY-like superfamily)
VTYFASAEELRDWLTEHHGTADELWVGYHKKHTGRPSVSWEEVVEESLRVGWVDSVRYGLDADRSAQRLTPRRKGSIWSARNVAIAERLIADGEMLPAGKAAFEIRSPEKTAIYSYERDAARFSAEETRRFKANKAAWADWQSRSPSYRRTLTFWVCAAKRPETRARRFETLVADSARGELVGPMRALRPRAKHRAASKGSTEG